MSQLSLIFNDEINESDEPNEIINQEYEYMKELLLILNQTKELNDLTIQKDNINDEILKKI